MVRHLVYCSLPPHWEDNIPVGAKLLAPSFFQLESVLVESESCVSKRVRSGTEQRMGRSQQVVGWPLESGRDVRTKTCVSGKGIFPKSRVLSEEKVLRAKGRGKLLNRSRVGQMK
jgi:hypothetical protein